MKKNKFFLDLLIFGGLFLVLFLALQNYLPTRINQSTQVVPYPFDNRESYPPPGKPAADVLPPPTEPPSDIIPTPIVKRGPTLTPWPTRPPRPTPTIRPGPTDAPYPLPLPAESPAGTILYGAILNWPSHYIHYQIAMSAEGKPLAAPEIIRLSEKSERINDHIYQIVPSPDGRYLLLVAVREPVTYPYVWDTQTNELTDPLDGIAGSGLFIGWHPDSRRFVFDVDGAGPWLIDAETGELTMLTINVYTQGAAISPDGTTIAYINDLDDREELWFVHSSGRDNHRVFGTGSTSFIDPGAWTPDGKRLVYWGLCGPEENAATQLLPLCLYDTTTGNRQLLNIPSYTGAGLGWSPDGKYLAVTGYDPDVPMCDQEEIKAGTASENCPYIGRSIYVQSMESGQVTKLVRGTRPTWSPDGSMLAFISVESGEPEIWSVELASGNLQQFTQDGLTKIYIEWY